ncbi:MAG: hypothetical protein ACC707_19115 [Thiohalomonadales bacterium]
MKSGSQIDRKTTAWIKAEVEQTLNSIQELPDQYLSNPNDISPIQACLAPMHRIKGALEIANIRGGVQLAHEMESLIQALCELRIKNIKDATEVLATCMLQLPGYLESLYYGQPDMPLILLPQLNDLRAAQERSLLTEGEFFSPVLSTVTPVEDTTCIINGEISTVAKKLRPGYLQGLLGIIKNDATVECIDLLQLVVENLRSASITNPSRQLWWISAGILESLKDQGLQASIALKILLGRVDQQIKRLIDYGENGLDQDATNKLKKNLLYYVSQSTSENITVKEIKKLFGLDYPSNTDIEQARAELYGFNVNLIDNISIQIREELAKIRDALDIALHANGGSTKGLEPITENISSVANALGMLGMTKMQSLIYEYQTFLIEKISHDAILDEEDFMGLAAAVLHIETSLDTFGMVIESEQDPDSQLPPAEYEKLIKLMAGEMLLEIKEIKSSLDEYLSNRANKGLLSHCSRHLQNVIGAADMLKQRPQSHIFQSIKDFLDHEISRLSENSLKHSQEFLADALVAAEYYYESVLEKSLAPDIALEKAVQSLTELGYAPGGEDNEVNTLGKTALSDFKCA